MRYFSGSLLSAFAFISLTMAADLSQYKTADELWLHITAMEREGPNRSTKDPGRHRAIITQFLGDMDAALVEFTSRYPQDARSWDAKLIRAQVLSARADVEGRKPDMAALEKTFAEIASAINATTETRAEASAALIELRAQPLVAATTPAALTSIDNEIAAFEKQFPKNERVGALRLLQARLYQKADPAKAESIARQLAKSPNPQISSEAQQVLFALELGKKPLSLKFKAVDGTTVDLEKLRGKVVLLDFWATWCGPCVVEVPNVVATYKKLHDKGFEIVGISLDSNKDKLLAFTKQREMTWPQFFDGKTWNNEISTRFQVSSIPAMWLVDKKGFVRDTNARANLTARRRETARRIRFQSGFSGRELVSGTA